MYPTAHQVAAVIAAMLKRSGQNRARLSTQTVKKIARRRSLRIPFIVALRDALSDLYDWQLIELTTGGFGAIQAKALEAAKPVTGMRFLTEEERKALSRGTADYDSFHGEAVADLDDENEDAE